MPDVLGRCPFCGDELQVIRLQCPSCHTAIEGSFGLGRFQRLAPDQLAFLEVFIKNRGIIRNVEAPLGLSYPTVRYRLDAVTPYLVFDGWDAHGPHLRTGENGESRRAVTAPLERVEP